MGRTVGERCAFLLSLISICSILLGFRVLVLIVWEFRNYFPPNFQADFLFGREDYFFGWYSVSFYIHIVASPVALVLGFLLIVSQRFRMLQSMHRRMGKIQAVLVVLLVAPSGLMMATRAMSGLIAGVGLALLAIATAGTMVVAVYYAQRKKIAIHRVWATRCFILLCSPLLLRLANGAETVLGVDSDLTYQLNAWLSWIVPLIGYECVRWKRSTTIVALQRFIFTSNEGVVHDG